MSPENMNPQPGENSGPSAAGQPPTDLLCPRCAYPLVKVEETGLSQCPECGEQLDFQRLRQLRTTGYSAHARCGGFWLIMQQPGRFFRDLPSPRHYCTQGEYGPSGPVFYWPAMKVGLLIGVCGAAAGILLDLPAGLIRSVLLTLVGLAALAVAQVATRAWIRGLLRRSGHGDEDAGSLRVTRFAGAAHVTIVAAFGWVLGMLGLAAFAARFQAFPLSPIFLCGALLSLGLCVLMWLKWAYLIMRAFQAETRGLEKQLAFWAFVNPGLVIVLVVPLLSGCCLGSLLA